jgi:hypothetical protein
MTRLLLGNLDPAKTDDEIGDFLVKYGFPPFDKVARAHPRCVLEDAQALRADPAGPFRMIGCWNPP